MLRSLVDLKGYHCAARDGGIGRLVDWYLDEGSWTICYGVVDLGRSFPEERGLLAVQILRPPDWERQTITVELSCEAIQRRLESLDALLQGEQLGRLAQAPLAPPASRAEHEPFLIGAAEFLVDSPGALAARRSQMRPGEQPATQTAQQDEPAVLRSAYGWTGYAIEAEDWQAVGVLKDFLVDDRSWSLDYLIVELTDRSTRKMVQVATDWIRGARDHDRVLRVGLTGRAIRQSPDFDPSAPANVQMETRRYDYFGRPRGRVGLR